jgi:hypothetical protein
MTHSKTESPISGRNFLENDGTLKIPQRLAGHADSRTTKLYDRRGQKVLLEDMERIRYENMSGCFYQQPDRNSPMSR